MNAEQLVLIGDPAVTAIAIFDCGEPFGDVAASELAVDHRLADSDGLYRRLRSGVISRLEQAQSLLPQGWRLAVIEGYRPIATQQRYFDEYLQQLRLENPILDELGLYRLATRHIAPVLSAGHPPHSTGGAVDLTVLDAEGAEIPVGCAVNATPEDSEGACYTDAPGLSASDRRNRDLLVAALNEAGLVNYQPEWWHWSYGDQYWALRTSASATRYSRAEEQTVLES